MLSLENFFCYAMASKLESHCLVRMKFLGAPRAVSASRHACYGVRPA